MLQHQARRSAQSGSPVVLLVDDHRDLRLLADLVFEREGLELFTAANGEEALQRIDGGFRPDVIVTDFHMGRCMNGCELLYQLRAIPELNGVPVLLMSDDPRIKELAEGAGFDDFLEKLKLTCALVAKVRSLHRN